MTPDSVKTYSDLGQLFTAHHVVILSEIHTDEKLPEVYKLAFAAAAAAGITDFGVEHHPNLQQQTDEAVTAYSILGQHHPAALDEVIQEMADAGDAYGCKLVLAAKYGIRLHCVDTAPRVELDVYQYLHPKVVAFKASRTDSGPEAFADSLSDEDMALIAKMTGQQDITPVSAVNMLLSMASRERQLAYIDNRVLQGDTLIMSTMVARAEGRPFAMIFGRAHGGLINEHEDGYEQVDLDGAACLVFGEEAVVRVDVSTRNGDMTPTGRPIHPAHYYLEDGGLVTNSRPAASIAFPDQQERLRLLLKHGIGAVRMGPLRNGRVPRATCGFDCKPIR